MKMMKVLLLVVLFLSPFVFARSGEDTGEFVKLASSVRAMGMGNAYVGIAEGIESLNYNPAGLATIKKKEGLLGYTKHFANISFSSIAYGQPISHAAYAIKMFLMNTSGGEEANLDNRTGKNVDISCRLISISSAIPFTQHISLGGSIKLINQDYAGYKGGGFSYDVGILGRSGPLSLGLSLNNIGRNIKIDNVENSLPFNIKGGLGYQIKENILLAFDIEKQKGANLIFRLGGEYNLLPNIDLRGGYDLISGYSMGFGIKSVGKESMKHVFAQIDYAYLYNLSLNSSHRVSILTRF